MKLTLFTIFDSKAEAYLQPYFSLNTGTGTRAFESAVQDPTTEFARHPADYTLFEIGTFDQAKGTVDMHQVQINLGNAMTFRQPAKGPMSLFAVGEETDRSETERNAQ